MVEMEVQSNETAGGILLAGEPEKPMMGTVLSIGSGRITEQGQRVPLEVSVGDKVVFPKYAGNRVKEGNEEFLIIRESDVLVIVQ